MERNSKRALSQLITQWLSTLIKAANSANQMRNLSQKDRLIRIIAGTLCFALATHYFWLLIFPAAVLIYTGFMAHCPIYLAARINEKQSIKKYYQSHLPEYNPNPVFIFNSLGTRVYANKPAETDLPELDKLSQLPTALSIGFEALLYDGQSTTEQYESKDKVYSISLKGIVSINCVVAYAVDISDALKANTEIINTQKDIVYAMGSIGETRSRETGNHVRRVAEYSYLLALQFGLSEAQANLLKMASPMHDIGKVAIPDAILNKPAKLTEDEFEVMKTHASLGYEMLCNSERSILKMAATVAHEHHEKWDGSGYPRQLAGTDIHIFGRITALADVFDALGSNRVYKKAWPLEKTLALIQSQSGRHFDPTLVKLFISHLDDFLSIRDRYQDDEQSPQASLVCARPEQPQQTNTSTHETLKQQRVG
jgi:response regulator RpfG family c-di-GMP phosphodiesterase